ncbi:MAG: 4-(cytidine 5'-diphospho)-2-C-methyl-D-erythritol kinase [Spirochaetota bacterium]
MREEVRILSPAKINLHLAIKKKREDGYHEILSLFQMVSLYDEITIRSLKSKDECFIDGRFDFPKEQNLMYKAVQLLWSVTGMRRGVHIKALKRIPEGAGLGGGSSNGASVLVALNELWETRFTSLEISTLSKALGSDVPFFCVTPAAIVTGRGEMICPVNPRDDYHIVLVYPGFKVRAKDAYDLFDRAIPWKLRKSVQEIPGDIIEIKYIKESPQKWNFFNSFKDVLEQEYPVLGALVEKLRSLGAEYANISGSGSSVFGIFLTKKQAEKAVRELQIGCNSLWILFPLDRKPEAILQ